MNGVIRLAAVAMALSWAHAATAANGIYSVEIDGNVAMADVSIGAASATLTVRFENVVGLTAENLGLSAKVVEPLALVSRLLTV